MAAAAAAPNVKINPYLSFDGNCEVALKFYARCFGGTIVYSTTY